MAKSRQSLPQPLPVHESSTALFAAVARQVGVQSYQVEQTVSAVWPLLTYQTPKSIKASLFPELGITNRQFKQIVTLVLQNQLAITAKFHLEQQFDDSDLRKIKSEAIERAAASRSIHT